MTLGRGARKRRTRQHIIADLACNHVERHALLCGYTVERIVHDYGTDLMMVTFDRDGEVENGAVFLQLKATDALPVLAGGITIAFPLAAADLRTWLSEPMPFILVIYDAQADAAYWLYLQSYFASLPGFNLDDVGDTVAVHVPMANLVDAEAMRRMAGFRDRIVLQMQRLVHRDE